MLYLLQLNHLLIQTVNYEDQDASYVTLPLRLVSIHSYYCWESSFVAKCWLKLVMQTAYVRQYSKLINSEDQCQQYWVIHGWKSQKITLKLICMNGISTFTAVSAFLMNALHHCWSKMVFTVSIKVFLLLIRAQWSFVFFFSNDSSARFRSVCRPTLGYALNLNISNVCPTY